GRFPGAKNIHEFWENLKNGVESVAFFTDEELKETVADPGMLKNPNFVKTKAILNDIEYFDASFFEYTPKEAEIMDPQVRIFHECAWEALEDAGYNSELFDGSIGLYAGGSSSLYWQALAILEGKTRETGQWLAGLLTDKDYLTLRVAYKLNLKGPSFLVQTACSTSLVAIHVACQAILNGECDMALSGGVTITLPHKSGYMYQQGMILSQDGHCRAFDSRAEGTFGGDGIGIVVLKRLEDALMDRDNIHAVIKGSAINNDGIRKMGFTAPSIEGQAEVIKIAHRMAHIEPESIGYIEAHGTGTTLGDPIEIEGLKLAFNTDKKGFCPIGSVKTNVGHLDAAAGVAGFIKTILALKHRLIPPSLHFETPNPKIDFENSPFRVNNKLVEWERDGYPLRAGVSSFGIGGTNAHVVLEEAPEQETDPGSRNLKILLLSAKTKTALEQASENLAEFLKHHPETNLADAAYTLQVGRGAFPHRRMVVGSDADSAAAALSADEPGKHPTFHLEEEDISTVFMFPGLGAQYVNMGLGLYETEPMFREEMDRCFKILQPLLDCDVKKILYPASQDRKSDIDINRFEISQVVVFTLEYALAKLLMNWGVKPNAMIGYSFGEYTAACLAGVFSLEDALKLVVFRGRLIARGPGGSMLSVPMTAGELTPLIPGDLSLAIDNGPSSIVAGPCTAVDTFEKYLREKRHLCMKLPNAYALHSKMMEPLLKEFEDYVGGITLNSPQIPYISNVTGTFVGEREAVDPAYWARHLRETVRFAGGIDELKKEPNAVFIEIGPGRDLTTLLIRHREDSSKVQAFNLVRQEQQDIPDDRYLLSKIGHLWLHGINIRWEQFHEGEKRRRIPLPTYAFEGRRFWIEGNPFSMADDATFRVSSAGPSGQEEKELFYLPSWKPAVLPVEPPEESAPPADACRLMFINESNLALQLVKRLEQEGTVVFRVKPGTGFEKIDDFTYTVNPRTGEDYHRLLTEIKAKDRFAASIVHLWGINQGTGGDWADRNLEFEEVDRAQELGLYSLLHLADGIGKSAPECRLKVVTNNMQKLPGDDGLCPEKSPVLAAVKMIPREYPNISCGSIDISLPREGTPREERLIEQLLAELKQDIYRPEVAYRGYERLEQYVEPVRLFNTNGREIPHRLKEKGVYLFTGGLEGIGFEIARYLQRLPLRPRLAFIENNGSSPAGDEGENRDKVAAESRLTINPKEETDFLTQREIELEKELEIKSVEDFDGLEQAFNDFSSSCILDYFRSRSVDVEAGKTYGLTELREQLKVMPKFNKFYDFFINALVEDNIAGIKDDKIEFLERVSQFGDHAALKEDAEKRFPGFKGSLKLLEYCRRHYSQALSGEMEAISVLFPGGESVEDREEHQDEVQVNNIRAYILLFKELFAKILEKSGGKKELRILEIGGGRGMLTRELTPILMEHNVRYHFTDLGPFFVINARKEAEEQGRTFMDFGVLDITKDPVEQGFEPHSFDMIVSLNVINATSSVEISLSNLKRLLAPNGALCLVEGTNPKRLLTMVVGLAEGWWYFEDSHLRPDCALVSLDIWEKVFEEQGFRDVTVLPGKGDRRSRTSAGLIFGLQEEEIYLETPEAKKREQNLKLLQKAGADFQLVQADMTNLEEMQEVVSQLQNGWGPVNGLFQCTNPGGNEVAGTLSSTIKNLLVMDKLFKDKPLDLFVYCAPPHSVTTGNGNMGSCAADIFMNSFSQYKLYRDNRFNVTLNWDPGVEIDIGPVFETLLDPSFAFNRLDVSSAEPESPVSPTYPGKTPGVLGEGKPSGERYRRPELSSDYVPPDGEIEQILVEIWQEFLGIDQVGISDDFLELGADSLVFVTIASRIHKALDVNVPIPEFFSRLNIKEVSKYIMEAKKEKHAAIEPAEKKEYYVMSSVQQRLYFLQQMDKQAIGYNIYSVLSWEGEMDRGRFEDTFKRLIKRHESLRTSFEMAGSEPVQKIHEHVEFKIEYHDLTDGKPQPEINSCIKNCIRPFDLSRPPLFRVGVIKETGNRRFLVVVDMHHIASDGISIGLIVKELMAFYNGEGLQDIGITYKDFSEWQNSREVKEARKQQENYWLKEFANEIPVLNLPEDFPRPAIQGFEGGLVTFEIEEMHTTALKTLALDEGATLFMLLLASFNILLSKLSGQEDIVVGTPVAGRRHSDLENIIGMFVNTLALRNFPNREKTVKQFLNEIKNRALKVFENQDYQYEDLVERVNVTRDAGRNPLFDTMFGLQNFDIPEVEFVGETIKPYPYEQDISRFDLSLFASEMGGVLACNLEYSTNLFKPATIERFINYFKKIIRVVIDNPAIEISGIEIISEEEKKRLLFDFNDTGAHYPEEKTLHQLFEEQVDKTPGHIAALFEEQHLTYDMLNRRSDRLASLLRQKGAGRGMMIGIKVKRSLEMIIGILGILKAGGAYLPIDPEYPLERIDYMLEDSAARSLLTGPEIAGLSLPKPLNDRPEGTSAPPSTSSDPAYVIYTSGSTGKPKGVMIEHRSIVNTLDWRAKHYQFSPKDVVLQLPAISFDSSVEDVFTPLISGSKLVLIRAQQRLETDYLKKFIKTAGITHFLITPTLYRTYLEDIPDALKDMRCVTIAGENFHRDLVERHYQKLSNVKLYNEYGPTENSVCATVYEFKPGQSRILIGGPIRNVRCYILRRSEELCPIGVAGELHLSGVGLAGGYLNNPELTAEKFVPAKDGSYRLYRTGDLARRLTDGNIEFLGRIDHQVKIRGFRIELGEIESQLLEYEEINEAVVTAREDAAGDKYLCAYIAAGSEVNISQLRESLFEKLPDHMIPGYFVPLERIPMTPHGKVDRKALPEPGTGMGTDSYTPPRDDVEKELVHIWSEILSIEKDKISIDANFFQLGGHSLRATVMLAKVQKALNMELPVAQVFKSPTIKGLSNYIKESTPSKYISLEPAEKKEYYQLSSAQRRLYVLKDFDEQGISYNIPSLFTLEGDADKNRFESTFKRLIERHESLRTSFHMIAGEPVQRVHEGDDTAFEIEYDETGTGYTRDGYIKNFVRPFDFSKAPLLRVGLLKEDEKKYLLMVDMHHIISDGVSSGLLIREFVQFYDGKHLPHIELQYKDFSEWRNSSEAAESLKHQEEYWLREFAGEIPALDLPCDFPRPAIQRFEGKVLNFEIDKETLLGLKAYALEEGKTLFMMLFALYNIFLSKISTQEDIVV
ncbi:MAG: amino acid adenylation domain-containing protein, partial [bacterium]|nr:amino acid adenylation domain-containing protein [bacterium]